MASTLRRRVVATEEPAEPPSPASTTTSRDDGPVKPGEGLELVLYPGKPPARKRKSTFIFFLGSLFGIIAAGFLAQNNELINLPELVDLNVESFLDVLPAAFVKDMRDLVVCHVCLCQVEVSKSKPRGCRTAKESTSIATTPSRSASKRKQRASTSTTPSL